MAQNFYNQVNGKKYNNIEQHICVLREVEFMSITREEPFNLKINDELRLLKKTSSSKQQEAITSNKFVLEDIFYIFKMQL